MDPAEPAELEDYLSLLVSLLSLVILVVAVAAWRRRPTTRTLLVTAAFGVFAVKAVFLVSDFVLEGAVVDFLESSAVVLDALFLVLIAIAFLKA